MLIKYHFLVAFFLVSGINLKGQNKLSNASRLALHESSIQSNKGISQALIQVDSGATDSILNSKGITINSKFGNIWSVQFLTDLIDVLNSIECINYIELTSKSNAARFKNDVERNASKVDKVQNGLQNQLPRNYSGKGVIVGIVDIGFQCNNPTFYTNDGSRTRIKKYWQQNNSSGTPPAGYAYGTEISDTTLIQLANDLDGSHGTHVAGIAAGSGFSTPNLQYRGMAPEADLVFVSIKYSNDTLGGSALGDYVVANPAILDAYRYIFDYAASVGKPAVINLSWGMHTGPHDGTSLFDLATEMLVGEGKILVGANGNEGDNPMHWNHKFNNDTNGTIIIENSRQFRKRESVYADFWGSANSSFSMRIEIIDTNKNIIVSTPFISSNSDKFHDFSIGVDSVFFSIKIVCEKNNPNNNKPNITVMVDHQDQARFAIIARITSANSDVHGWNSGASREWTSGSFRNILNKLDYSSSLKAGNTEYTVGENGGTSKAVISVGATAARTAYRNVKGEWINDSAYVKPGEITRFSSKGPTADGRIKPDISAPGYDIPSSVNNQRLEGYFNVRNVYKSVFRGDTNYWVVFNGTSMAAPHVAGIVALLLEAYPKMTAQEAKEILQGSAIVDQFTGAVPNNSYGYGKVDAYSAIIRTLQVSGIDPLRKNQVIEIYPNPFNAFLTIKFPLLEPDASLSITGIDGKTVYNYTGNIKSFSSINIDQSSLPPGIYFMRFINGGEIVIHKLVKT